MLPNQCSNNLGSCPKIVPVHELLSLIIEFSLSPCGILNHNIDLVRFKPQKTFSIYGRCSV